MVNEFLDATKMKSGLEYQTVRLSFFRGGAGLSGLWVFCGVARADFGSGTRVASLGCFGPRFINGGVSCVKTLSTQQLREALQRGALLSPEEHWQKLVDAGIIDEQGQVLKRARNHRRIPIIMGTPPPGHRP